MDTPGHADFGGEVERVLKMADGALLLVDAAEGVLPQTKFVLRKAFMHGLRPIVVINKIDRPDARPLDTLDQVFDLFVSLGASESQLDFPYLFAAGRLGFARRDLSEDSRDLRPLFETILSHVPPPPSDVHSPLRIQVANIDYNDYVGRIAIGRIFQGVIRRGETYEMIGQDGSRRREKVTRLEVFEGLERVETDEAAAGEIIALSGFEEVHIGDTLCAGESAEPLPPIPIDEPTLSMMFLANDSPFSGREGRFVTGRQLWERLQREALRNVAMRVEKTESPNRFKVSGRGLLHLGVLIETMRREGYELQVGKPHVISRQIEGKLCEPFETISIDVPETFLGRTMELLGSRKCSLERMSQHAGHCHLEFVGPSRGLIGLRNRLLTATRGEAVMHHSFLEYREYAGDLPGRVNGVMVASESGRVTAYALLQLEDRGDFFVVPGEEVYEGQIVGEHCKDNDIAVNVARTKHLTNIRSSTKEHTEVVKAPRNMPLEEAMEYIEEDELVEVSPKAVRLRKKLLKERDRIREARNREKASAPAG
ncbi:MAG: GTP-binding protein [Planctomycetota bacterium]|nr:GTP-binding protein [Planctomycetota bacterium]